MMIFRKGKINIMSKSRTHFYKKFFSLPLLVATFVLLTAGAFLIYRTTRTSPANNTPGQSKTPEITPTYESTAEGSTVTVPTDVPSESIRNYELITENEQYKIRYNGSSYLITLYAIINNPDQYDNYRDQLREYKQNALNYLKNKGVDVNKASINYEPKEATDL